MLAFLGADVVTVGYCCKYPVGDVVVGDGHLGICCSSDGAGGADDGLFPSCDGRVDAGVDCSFYLTQHTRSFT